MRGKQRRKRQNRVSSRFYLKAHLPIFLLSALQLNKFRIIKSEIRILGVDDGQFEPHTQGTVIVIGVVFRGGQTMDGVMHTHVEIDGFNATEQLATMVNKSSHYRQLRLIMLNGVTLAGFNIVDIQKLNEATNLPVIAVTLKKPDLGNIREALLNLSNPEDRWQSILSAGEIHEIRCKGKTLYIEIAGISIFDAQEIIKATSINSSFPEPLRVAHMVASGVTP